MLQNAFFGAVLLTGAVAASAASLDFSLSSSLIYARPGEQVTFAGALTNIGASNAFLNGDSFTFVLPLDDLPFLSAPPVLMPGQTYTGPIFNVLLPPATAPGLYIGAFNVLGGDSAAEFSVLATAPFGVQAIPEPPGFSLTLAGLAAVAISVRQSRRGTSRL